MKVVLHYRHEDGRQMEVRGDSSQAELWLLYPHQELVETASSLDEAKEKLPEGFNLVESLFMPPCPKCSDPSPMSLDTGMYVCEDCDLAF